MKPLAEVLAELDLAQSLRRLDCVTLIGGEPLLHPELPAIIRAVRSRGPPGRAVHQRPWSAISKALELKAAGLELAVMHLEGRQEREDLADASPGALRRLREGKLALLAEAGLEGGLSITAMPDCEEEVAEAVELAVASPPPSFFLVTLFQDPAAVPDLVGDIDRGFRTVGPSAGGRGSCRPRHRGPGGRDPALGGTFHLPRLHPGGSPLVLPPGGHRPRGDSVPVVRSLRITRLDMLLNRLLRLARGRYSFYQPQRRRLPFVHLLLNGLAGGGFRRNLDIVTRALRPGASLRMKRFLLQVPAGLDAGGPRGLLPGLP